MSDRGRLEALAETGLLDSLPEESFDRYTRMAKTLLKADVSLLSLVAENRQFFKSQFGLPSPYDELRETPLSHSFCKVVVETGQPLVVEDARLDERVKDNLAVRDLGVISYLGFPVRSDDGYLLGSMCAITVQPREWSREDIALMSDIRAMVSTEVSMRQRNSALRDAVFLLEESAQDRERAERMLVHDLRTPVSSILQGIELIEITPPALNSEQADYLRLIRESGEMLNSMIRDVLLSDGADRTASKSVSISSLLRRSAAIIRPLAENDGLNLQIIPPIDGELSGTKVRSVERILLNLLTNAVKFSPKGGNIVLSARPDRVGDQQGVRFEVSDTGPGVPESERESIFGENIVGTAQSLRGPASLGLGLAYCKSAVSRFGGSIGVEDSKGGGSTFFFVLPY